MTVPALVTLLTLLLPMGAWAEQVYRCQTKEGVAYQDIPCVGPGGPVEIQVHRPSAAEVSRSEEALSRMRSITSQIQAQEQAESGRATGRAASPPRASGAGERTAAVQPQAPGTQDKSESRERDDDDDLRPTSACPLGLTNCKKADPRVFRRPKSAPLGPLQTPQ